MYRLNKGRTLPGLFFWCSHAGDQNKNTVEHRPRTRSFTSLSPFTLVLGFMNPQHQAWMPQKVGGCLLAAASQLGSPASRSLAHSPLGASRHCQTSEPAGPHFFQPATPSLPLGSIPAASRKHGRVSPRSLLTRLRGPGTSAAPSRAAAAGGPQCRAGAPQCRAGARRAPSETDGASAAAATINLGEATRRRQLGSCCS